MTKEKPILFSAPMVRAVLDGSKTQTRRIVKPKPYIENNKWWLDLPKSWLPTKRLGFPVNMDGGESIWKQVCPYGKVGDRLWVRENFSVVEYGEGYQNPYVCDDFCEGHARVQYFDNGFKEVELSAEDEEQARRAFKKKTVPSIHMPRWASRIDLEITNIRVERLQDISEDDAMAEGIRPSNAHFKDINRMGITAFKSLWQSINGADSWNENPLVWVVEFERVE